MSTPIPAPTEEYKPEPKPKKISRIKKISVQPWDADGNFTITVKVKKPWMSASQKCYLMCCENGETDMTINVDGKDRPVRVSLMVYSKIPADERKESVKQEAIKSEQRGEPKLF